MRKTHLHLTTFCLELAGTSSHVPRLSRTLLYSSRIFIFGIRPENVILGTCHDGSEMSSTETFSPVVKPATIQTLLALAITRYWSFRQLDINNAFLNDILHEQAPRAWYNELTAFLAKLVSIPMVANSILTLHSGELIDNPTEYCALVESLQYLTLTRPDVAYDNYTSTMGHVICLGRNPVCWSSKKQRFVAQSSTEAEYKAVAATAAEILWLRSLLSEIGVYLSQTPIIYCDNLGATRLSANPVFHSRMKHLALAYHFVREQVQHGSLRVTHVSTGDHLADPLTKHLARAKFEFFMSKIGLSNRSSILRGHDKDKNKT
uniref:Uncharacterized mitochondrial protein AtMg00810-like n=1 Tax=Tanacetum cinerariifolium TaxID=118510 RepID=A0A6L2L775_TANCI|nr:uncharacterized mitochondrial protein AtMg00810-like [Tanacetum cinerariifolium]